MVELTEKFRFIREDVFLCLFGNKKDGKQWLELRKVDSTTGEIEFKDIINCTNANMKPSLIYRILKFMLRVNPIKPVSKGLYEKIILSILDLNLPQDIFGEIYKLDFKDHQLLSIPESIEKLTSLENLSIRCNQITILPESIGKLASLKELMIVDTQLKSIPESIGRLSLLKRLYLGKNQLLFIPESIGNLTSLVDLDLQDNQLTSLPESIGSLSALKSLYLENNQLTYLPESIGNLTSLVDLDLQDNQLTSLPESINKLVSLKNLGIAGNQLTFFPKSFEKFKLLDYLNELNSLDLEARNYFKRLNGVSKEYLIEEIRKFKKFLKELKRIDKNELKFLKDMEKLDEFFLIENLTDPDCWNPLTIENGHIIIYDEYQFYCNKLPESIGNLKQLEELILDHESTSILSLKIPKTITTLKQLEKICISNFNIIEMPNDFKDLKKLKNLSIRGTNFTEIPEAFRGLKNLECLNLQSGSINKIPKWIGEFKNLKKLNLSLNKIKEIPESIQNLKSLECLNLEFNNLIYLPKSIGKLTALESMKLNSNSLFTVPESITKLGKLKNLDLEYNDFDDIPESLRTLELNGCEVKVFISDSMYRRVGDYTSDGKVGYFPLYVDRSIRLHLYDKYISLNKVEKDLVGTFELKSGKIIAQDPCYGWPPEKKEDKEKQFGYTAFGIPVVKGKWYGYVIKVDYWTGSLIAVHEDFLKSKTKYTDWLFISSTIAVDSGIAGIFDFDSFKKCNLDDHEKCYEELISFEHRYGKIWQENGIYSSSGGSDGGYPVYVYKNSDNKAVILWIDFFGLFLADIWNEVMKAKRNKKTTRKS